MDRARFISPHRHWIFSSLLFIGLAIWHSACVAQTSLQGQWFAAPQAWRYQGQASLDSQLQPVERIAPTGGAFWYQASIEIDRADTYVIDFKNSSVIGRFHHRVLDANGALLAEFVGGIQSNAINPFFLRHGRELALPAGRYTLLTQIDSPFYLAEPTPYVDTLSHYRQAINAGNSLVLFCLGIFCGLGIYYLSLSVVRRRTADCMYALFILGNILYNGMALLVFPALFNSHGFYWISMPILFSNMAYVLFVAALLEINAETYPRLNRVKQVCLGVLAVFILTAVLRPNWSLQLDRFGVGIFMLFGFACGIAGALRGNQSARLYLIANIALLVPGLTSISLLQLNGLYTVYIEHLGLLAVTIEIIMLALVLSYQFGLLYRERAYALDRAKHHLLIAHTDALTGLPNRYALEAAVLELPEKGSLTFVDLDGLKHYNDYFGHERGNVLLRSFAKSLAEKLGQAATVHRVGGDEFAITSPQGAVAVVEHALSETLVTLQAGGFEFSGASYGSVYVVESPDRTQLEHIADSRMYEHKRERRLAGPQRDFSASANQNQA